MSRRSKRRRAAERHKLAYAIAHTGFETRYPLPEQANYEDTKAAVMYCFRNKRSKRRCPECKKKCEMTLNMSAGYWSMHCSGCKRRMRTFSKNDLRPGVYTVDLSHLVNANNRQYTGVVDVGRFAEQYARADVGGIGRVHEFATRYVVYADPALAGMDQQARFNYAVGLNRRRLRADDCPICNVLGEGHITEVRGKLVLGAILDDGNWRPNVRAD